MRETRRGAGSRGLGCGAGPCAATALARSCGLQAAGGAVEEVGWPPPLLQAQQPPWSPFRVRSWAPTAAPQGPQGLASRTHLAPQPRERQHC